MARVEGVGHHVCNQTEIAIAHGPRRNGDLAHAGLVPQNGFDLGRFDAKTVDLELIVDASVEGELPIGSARRPGRRCGRRVLRVG